MEDQTALSLEECLRLLEATFPFGENSEVGVLFTLGGWAGESLWSFLQDFSLYRGTGVLSSSCPCNNLGRRVGDHSRSLGDLNLGWLQLHPGVHLPYVAVLCRLQ